MASQKDNQPPVALTIAGFDPSGGAGIIADIKTFVAFGCFPTAAITSLTFQNSESITGTVHQTAESVRAQITAIVQEFRVAAVKIGMLPTREILLEVVGLLREYNLPAPVVDPVLRSTSGYDLMEVDAIEALLSELMPLSRLLTPNVPEAERLTGLRITDEGEMREAAQKLRRLGARAVLVKGGHLKERSKARGQNSDGLGEAVHQVRDVGQVHDTKSLAIDVLDDQGQIKVFGGEWIDSPPIRGTGCILSSAIAACLAQRMPLDESVRAAKNFVAEAIRYAPGPGPGPVTLELTETTHTEN